MPHLDAVQLQPPHRMPQPLMAAQITAASMAAKMTTSVFGVN
ncbi:MAG: hypothetical protein R3C49_26265 [Planctomycetaceae bacterium]